ncbi:YbaB/EbfC family nucleoid-associated protein [Actinacidiphila sp. bgisy167]|uniref:YbaB/EbfC family nucleoid-associated protein n=1 Tax=Actinacidiphila sp. bgisy167 TaxID=3413797 RepID=UPI003D75E9D8
MESAGGLDIQRLLNTATRMKQDLLRAQEELRTATVQGSAGGGAVRATVNGKGELQKLVISPAIADPDNAHALAAMVVSAVRDAQHALAARSEERLLPVLDALDRDVQDLSG